MSPSKSKSIGKKEKIVEDPKIIEDEFLNVRGGGEVLGGDEWY
jgi:hypothetical protein